jgi:hypothetical protein
MKNESAAILAEREFLGELSFFDKSPSSAYLMALCASEIEQFTQPMAQ